VVIQSKWSFNKFSYCKWERCYRLDDCLSRTCQKQRMLLTFGVAK